MQGLLQGDPRSSSRSGLDAARASTGACLGTGRGAQQSPGPPKKALTKRGCCRGQGAWGNLPMPGSETGQAEVHSGAPLCALLQNCPCPPRRAQPAQCLLDGEGQCPVAEWSSPGTPVPLPTRTGPVARRSLGNICSSSSSSIVCAAGQQLLGQTPLPPGSPRAALALPEPVGGCVSYPRGRRGWRCIFITHGGQERLLL